MLLLLSVLCWRTRIHNHVDVVITTAVLAIALCSHLDQVLQHSLKVDNWLLGRHLISPLLVQSFVQSFLLEVPKQASQRRGILTLGLGFLEKLELG